jgi:hypothetical protein
MRRHADGFSLDSEWIVGHSERGPFRWRDGDAPERYRTISAVCPRPLARDNRSERRPQWITSISSSTARQALKVPDSLKWKTPEERVSISANGNSGRMDIGRFAFLRIHGSLDGKVMLEDELQRRATCGWRIASIRFSPKTSPAPQLCPARQRLISLACIGSGWAPSPRKGSRKRGPNFRVKRVN